MKNISTTISLNETILRLEKQKDENLKELKEQFNYTYESLKPINIIKSIFKEITQSPDLRGNISSAAIGIASGYLMKGIVFGSSMNPVSKLAGILFQSVVTNLAAKNSDSIKATGETIIEKIVSLFKSKNGEDNENKIEKMKLLD